MTRARVLIFVTMVLLAAMGSQATTYSIIIPVKAKGSGPLYRIKRDNKWGFMNRQGKVVIQRQFDEARDFFDGLAAVQVVNAWGYIRESGEVAVPVTYDSASDFKEQRATVCRDDLCGVIDTAGTRLTRLEFSEVKPFSEGLAAVWVGAKQTPFSQNAVLVHGGRWGFIDRTGKIVIEPQFDHIQSFSEGLAAFGVGGRRDKKGDIVALDGALWGFIDPSGKIAIPPAFDEVEPFNAGVAQFYGNYLHGLIDHQGRQLPNTYLQLGPFTENLACAVSSDASGFVTPDGQMRIKTVTWGVSSSCSTGFSEGLAAVGRSVGNQDRIGFIDAQGLVSIEFQFEDAGDFSEGLAAARVNDNDLYGYIDKKGNFVIPSKYARAHEFVDGLALVVTKDGRWDYIDRTGATVARDVFHY